MKKILVIQGGGRPRGNTVQLVESFARGARDAGHEVEIISLIKNEVKGCIGCNMCRYGKPCVQKDAFNSIVPKMTEADLLAFASPLYFWTITARLKAFIERFYCVARYDPAPPFGRAVVNYIGFRDMGTLLAGGCGDTNGAPQIDKTNHLEEAYLFGKNIYA